MNQSGPFLFLVILLIIVGLGAAQLRHSTYDIPWSPGTETEIWQVEARIEFDARGSATQVYLTLPPEQQGFAVVSEAAGSIPTKARV